jgi:hypothetical protein
MFNCCLFTTGLVILIIGGIIGGPCLAESYNEYETDAIVQFDTFVPDTCSNCIAYDKNGICTLFLESDCSYWSIDFLLSDGKNCVMRSDSPYILSTKYRVIASYLSSLCNTNLQRPRNFFIVGVFFLVLAGVGFIILIISFLDSFCFWSNE